MVFLGSKAFVAGKAGPHYPAPVAAIEAMEKGAGKTRDALPPLLEAAQCEFPEPENEFLRIDSAADYLAVDRLYLDVYTGVADVRVGSNQTPLTSPAVLDKVYVGCHDDSDIDYDDIGSAVDEVHH